MSEGTSVAARRLGMALRQRRGLCLADFWLRRSGNYPGNTFADFERTGTIEIGALMVIFLNQFGHVAA